MAIRTSHIFFSPHVWHMISFQDCIALLLITSNSYKSIDDSYIFLNLVSNFDEFAIHKLKTYVTSYIRDLELKLNDKEDYNLVYKIYLCKEYFQYVIPHILIAIQNRKNYK